MGEMLFEDVETKNQQACSTDTAIGSHGHSGERGKGYS